MSYLRDSKIREAVLFFNKMNVNNNVFLGISGSVSYEPKEGDDIDIFLISRDGLLWLSILSIFIFRRVFRLKDLCPSLSMDSSFAVEFFRNMGEGLAARDSLKVIPIYGERYYASLLQLSPAINRGKPAQEPERVKGPIFLIPFEILAFIFVASWVNLKGIYSNRPKNAKSEGGFKTVFSLHKFYFDTEKYKRLKEDYLRSQLYEEDSSNL
ncbi:MAG: hypothetical protein QW062_04595 [Thermoplasmatales archaeon]